MKKLVIYHANCVDGFTAAWAAWRRFGDLAEYVAAQYGDAMPDVTGRDVYIVDFSFPRAELIVAYYERAASLLVLDHHKTAREALDGLDFCVFDMSRSGAGIAWDELHRDLPRPALVNYVEDRDLWRWALPDSKEISAYIGTLPKTFEAYDAIARRLDSYPEGIVDAGSACLRLIDQYVEGQKAKVRTIQFHEYDVPCVNTTFAHSELIGELAEGKPFALGWFERDDGMQVFSLRSRDGGLDVAEIAQRFGGGGHRAAAGFTVSAEVGELIRASRFGFVRGLSVP